MRRSNVWSGSAGWTSTMKSDMVGSRISTAPGVVSPTGGIRPLRVRLSPKSTPNAKSSRQRRYESEQSARMGAVIGLSYRISPTCWTVIPSRIIALWSILLAFSEWFQADRKTHNQNVCLRLTFGVTTQSRLPPTRRFHLIRAAASGIERPQLLLLTSLQPRLSTKGAAWLRLLYATQPLLADGGERCNLTRQNGSVWYQFSAPASLSAETSTWLPRLDALPKAVSPSRLFIRTSAPFEMI